MSRPINPADLPAIQRIATEEAMRLCRSLGLPPQDRADVGNDLLADLLARLPAYDPSKGTLGGFARVCMRHAAFRMAQKHRHQRRVARTVSLDDPLPGGDGLTLADTLSEGDHSLCAALTTATPHEVAAQGAMPRARIYRRIREMRLRLLAAGIPSAA